MRMVFNLYNWYREYREWYYHHNIFWKSGILTHSCECSNLCLRKCKNDSGLGFNEKGGGVGHPTNNNSRVQRHNIHSNPLASRTLTSLLRSWFWLWFLIRQDTSVLGKWCVKILLLREDRLSPCSLLSNFPYPLLYPAFPLPTSPSSSYHDIPDPLHGTLRSLFYMDGLKLTFRPIQKLKEWFFLLSSDSLLFSLWFYEREWTGWR